MMKRLSIFIAILMISILMLSCSEQITEPQYEAKRINSMGMYGSKRDTIEYQLTGADTIIKGRIIKVERAPEKGQYFDEITVQVTSDISGNALYLDEKAKTIMLAKENPFFPYEASNETEYYMFLKYVNHSFMPNPVYYIVGEFGVVPTDAGLTGEFFLEENSRSLKTLTDKSLNTWMKEYPLSEIDESDLFGFEELTLEETLEQADFVAYGEILACMNPNRLWALYDINVTDFIIDPENKMFPKLVATMYRFVGLDGDKVIIIGKVGSGGAIELFSKDYSIISYESEDYNKALEILESAE